MKCKVCAWRVCATCQDVRGEDAPIIPELTHPTAEDSGLCDDGTRRDTPVGGGQNETRDKNAVPLKNERAYEEEHAEHDHVHPTQNEEKICQSFQLQVEGAGSTDAKRVKTPRNASC